MISYSAVIPAAGSGTRMHLGYNKVYLDLNGRPLLARTIDVFEKDSDCKEIVVVTDPNDYEKNMANEHFDKVKVVAGGSSRQESISHGLKEIHEDIVMIHDGARPYISEELLNSLKKTMEHEKAACLAVPCKDTIKVVKDGHILQTIPRETLMAAQTPQVFYTNDILYCMDKAIGDHFIGTDDCSIVEKYLNIQIAIVEGSYENIKITTPEDIKK